MGLKNLIVEYIESNHSRTRSSNGLYVVADELDSNGSSKHSGGLVNDVFDSFLANRARGEKVEGSLDKTMESIETQISTLYTNPTVVAAAFDGSKAYIATLGYSMVYRFSDDKKTKQQQFYLEKRAQPSGDPGATYVGVRVQLRDSINLVQRVQVAGELPYDTTVERTHAGKMPTDKTTLFLRPGDTYILCSNRLHGHLSLNVINDVISSTGSMKEAYHEMMSVARKGAENSEIVPPLIMLEVGVEYKALAKVGMVLGVVGGTLALTVGTIGLLSGPANFSEHDLNSKPVLGYNQQIISNSSIQTSNKNPIPVEAVELSNSFSDINLDEVCEQMRWYNPHKLTLVERDIRDNNLSNKNAIGWFRRAARTKLGNNASEKEIDNKYYELAKEIFNINIDDIATSEKLNKPFDECDY